MNLKKLLGVVCSTLAIALTVSADAQKPTEAKKTPAPSQQVPDGGMPTYVRPETPAQRQARLGTAEDPGLDPDPSKHYWRFGKSMHITKYERRWAAYDTGDTMYVRPLAMANFAFEIYQQNDKYVWVWARDPDPQEQAAAAQEPPVQSRWKPDHIAYFKRIRNQFAALDPAKSDKSIVFQESSDGLPREGSWRNSLTVADMNEDGSPDIVTPPARKSAGVPQIFLGDGKGHWKPWAGSTFTHAIDYGGVAAGDFNGDGHVDLVFAVHLNGLYVFLGDGKGHFTASSNGLPHDFPTRRVVVTDVDGDGAPDIVASTEGPAAIPNQATKGLVRAYLNRRKGTAWEEINVTDPEVKIGGDWLSIGDLNGDRYPDFVTSSVFFGGVEVIQLSSGLKKWVALPTDGDVIPSLSYYFASATGKFVKGAKRDDAIVSYTRYWPSDLDRRDVPPPDITNLTDIDRIVFTENGAQRIPIMRWSGEMAIAGLAAADFDGDGNLDILFLKQDTREIAILLGDGAGNFRASKVEGASLLAQPVYDVKVADVNRDGRPDVILMYESGGARAFSENNGSIKVFLNRGPRPVRSEATVAK